MPNRSESAFVFVLTAVLAGVGLGSATAQTCVDDVTGVSNNCTANDVSLTSVTVAATSDGCVGPGDTATVDLLATLQSGTTRYDIGIFLAQDGGDAFTGSCFHDFFPPPLQIPPGHNPSSGTGPYANLEGVGGDSCGDIVTGELTARLVTGITVTCSDTDADGFVDIGNCLSWDNQVSNNCTSVAQAVPGTKAKCNCTRINSDLGIPNLQLTKSCTPDTASPGDTVSCTITYINSGTGPGDYISFIDDYSETQATVSNIVAPGGDTAVDDGFTITWTPGGAPALQANVAPGATGTLTYDLTLSNSLVNNEQVPNTVTAQWQGIAQTSLQVTEIINISATAALVTSFDVVASPEGRAVLWETSSETRTAGFYLERWVPAANAFVRLNADPLPAVLQPQGGSYRYLDDSPQQAAALVYRLIELEFDGREIVVDTYRRTLSKGQGSSETSFSGAVYSHRAHTFSESARPMRGAGAAGRATHPRAHNLGPLKRLISEDSRMKLYLRETALHRVTDAAIAEAYGLDAAQVRHALRQGRVRLSRRGQSIPWLSSPDGTSLAFYAPPFERTYSLDDVVWLDLDFGSQLHAPRPARRRYRSSAEPGRTFVDSLRVEEDVLPAVVMGTLDPEGDFWFWSFVQGKPMPGQHWDFTVSDPGGSGQATLTVDFQGFARGVEHVYTVFLNGVELGDTRFVGDVYHSASFDVEASVLRSGSNRLEITPSSHAAPFIGAFLDGFSLDYPRQYRAVSDRLAFQGTEDPVVTVTGFTSPEVSVWDVSDPELPQPIPVLVESGPAGTGWQATLEPVPGARYVASASGAFVAPERWESVSRPSLKASLDGVDYVIVVPRAMEAEARSFADYRAGTGFRPLVATIEDIQNEFTDGLWDPHAVHEFLRVWHSRLAPADTGYVLLAGKGTFDYRDLLGAGTNLLPPLLVQTHDGLVASDHLLGDVVGDDLVPELAVARVPVLDASELRSYFDKVRLFESAPSEAPWRKKLVFVADNSDIAGDFVGDTESMMALVPAGFTSMPILLGKTHTVTSAREAILYSWNEGASLVAYTGHASQILWANEILFDIPGAASLVNGERLPLLVGLSCYMGRFDYPTFDSLASTALLNPSGGAIAVVSPSGTSVNMRATRLGNELVERVLSSGGRTLGQSVLETFPAIKSDPATLQLLATYNFLGDPAVILRP